MCLSVRGPEKKGMLLHSWTILMEISGLQEAETSQKILLTLSSQVLPSGPRDWSHSLACTWPSSPTQAPRALNWCGHGMLMEVLPQVTAKPPPAGSGSPFQKEQIFTKIEKANKHNFLKQRNFCSQCASSSSCWCSLVSGYSLHPCCFCEMNLFSPLICYDQIWERKARQKVVLSFCLNNQLECIVSRLMVT